MHISLWCSDMLHTLKPGSRAVSLQHVLNYLISLLLPPPAHSGQASSLHPHKTVQTDTRSPTQNYKRKNLPIWSAEREQKYWIVFNKPFATACKSRTEKALSRRSRMALVSCGQHCSSLSGLSQPDQPSTGKSSLAQEGLEEKLPPWLVSPRNPSTATPRYM